MMSKSKSCNDIAKTQEILSTCDCKYCLKARFSSLVNSIESMKKFFCKKCNVGFMMEESYKLHLYGFIHNHGNPYECLYCGDRFSEEEELKSHVRNIHRHKHEGHGSDYQNCLVCLKTAVDNAIADIKLASAKASEKKLQLLRLRREYLQDLRLGPPSSSSSPPDGEQPPSKYPGKNRGKKRHPKDKPKQSVSVPTTASATSTATVTPTSSQKEKIYCNLYESTTEKPITMQAIGMEEIKSETKGGFRERSHSQPNWLVETKPQNFLYVWNYLSQGIVQPPLLSWNSGEAEQSMERLSTSRSFEMPRNI